MCCLLPEYVYGELFFFFVPLLAPATRRVILWYRVLCSSFTVYCWERTRVGWAGDAPIGLSTKEVSEGMEPSSLDPLCREGRQATSWNALASIAMLHSSFLSPEDGIFFSCGHTCKSTHRCPQNQHGPSVSECWLRDPHQTGGEIHWSHLCWSSFLPAASARALRRPRGVHPY